MAFAAAGCATVPKEQFDQLNVKASQLDEQNKALNAQLLSSEAAKADLQNRATLEAQRANAAEAQLAQFRATGAGKPNGAVAEPAKPTHEKTSARTGKDYTLSSEIFPAGKATLTSAGKQKVDELAATLKKQHAGNTILVYGYTDSDPIKKSSWKDNLELSAQRAMAVTRELIAKGIAAKNIETVAMGSEHPVAANSTASGKAQNRRVIVRAAD
jgi:chemotaxis protein MotB